MGKKNKVSKRRYNSARVAKSPLLKKTIAILLAEHSPRSPDINLTSMLAYGHRGYISHSEDDLCKMFDKLYSLILETLPKRIETLKEQQQARNSRYGFDNYQIEIDKTQTILNQFENVADEIFEKKVLL